MLRLASPASAATKIIQVSTATQLEHIDQNQSQYLRATIELLNDIAFPARAGGASSNWTPFGTISAHLAGHSMAKATQSNRGY